MNSKELLIMMNNKLEKIMKYIHFDLCMYVLIIKIIRDLSFFIITVCNIKLGYLYILPLSVLLKILLELYVLLGFYKYGIFIKNIIFKKYLISIMALVIISPILSIIGIYKYKFIEFSMYVVISFLLFKAFKVIIDITFSEIKKLANSYRFLFTACFLILVGYVLSPSIYTYQISSFLTTIGTILLIVTCILIYYFSIKILRKLHLKYESKPLPDLEEM